MSGKKILLLLPDGVGVRNFVYTDFIDKSIAKGLDIFLWSEPSILKLIESTDCGKIELPVVSSTDILAEIQRKAWQTGMLQHLAKEFNDPIYLSYIFPLVLKSLKNKSKDWIQQWYIKKYQGYKGLGILKQKYLTRISKLRYFKECITRLKEEKPAILFCTHQRAIKAIAPLMAAKELGIPTVCFIYSWDNLPKATLFVESDYYLVWSDLMKREMLMYYPEIKENRIIITGTPQFIPYFDEEIKKVKVEFAKDYNLPSEKKWICFSGDDLTTSPHDQIYLQHLAECVMQWNSLKQDKLHIIFRKCPADKSSRYDNVLKQYETTITAIDPIWRALDPEAGWHTIIPGKEDIALLVNTVLHSELVINVGSTMAHDFSILNKPCIYINYNVNNSHAWNIKKLYKYIHFNSMKDFNPVIWVNSREDYKNCLELALYSAADTVKECGLWHQTIALYPLNESNEKIISALSAIVNKSKNDS